jgi:hypothetical protein
MNPYVWNEVNPELCYGRDALLSEMLSFLPGNPRYSFGLAGGRRMGKSTILRRVEMELKVGGLRVIPIYIDGLALPRPLAAPQVWGHVLREIQRALPEASFEVNALPDFDTFKESLQPVLTNLPEYRRVIVLFDEIEPITACDWSPGFWAHWRALLSNTPGLQEYFTVVFAGARELATLRHDIGSPLADILQWRNLHCLEFEDACDLMQQPVEREWPTSFLDLVYQETGGHPFLLQYVMQHVCNTSNDTEELAKQAVRQAVNKFSKERGWQFGEWWQRYCTEMAQRVYHRLPDDGSTLPLRALTLEFGSTEANEALEILQHVGLVAADDDGFAFRYTGEMFRRWYRDNVPKIQTPIPGPYQSNEVMRLISSRESATLEFKSSIRWDYRQNKVNKELEKVIVKTIAGFLNVNGGKLLIGVDDTGTVLGLKNDYQTLKKKDSDGFELFITQLISNYIGKEFCLYIHTSFHDVNGEDVCLVDVEACPKPAYIQEDRNVEFYIRTGGSTQLLNAKEVTEYVLRRWGKG